MAKVSGIGSALLWAHYDLSGDTQTVTTADAIRNAIEVTSIQDPAPYRLPGRKDGAVAFTSYWNVAAGQAVPVLDPVSLSDVLVTWAVGSAVGDPGFSMRAKETSYAPSFPGDGSLTANVSAESNDYGAEWGQLLTTGRQTFVSGTVTGTSIDYGAVSTLFGAAAYLHAISITSGTATVKVQDSADNAAFADVAGMGFTTVSAATSERVQGTAAATVRRYLRINVSGSYANLVAVVNVVRYISSPNA